MPRKGRTVDNGQVETLHDRDAGRFRVRMVTQPASVPMTRRFVEEALTSLGCAELVDDVSLCVSELATNATLHSGSGYFDVELEELAEGMRLVVLDGGGTPAGLIAARADSYLNDEVLGDLEPDLDAEGMTGRGLSIVSALAAAWGIEGTHAGTRVWAVFTGRAPAGEPVGPSSPQVAGADTPDLADLPGDWFVVRLERCPPGLLLAHDENLADTVRELQLMGAEPTSPNAEVLDEIAGVVRRNALTWDAARLKVRAALQAGEAYVDIAVLAPHNIVEEVARLRHAVDLAEQMSRDGTLITLPVPEPVQRLRDWMEQAFTEQTVEGREPVPFPDWLAARS
jgi:anti-sigma regulatory factor (Ser/Thr protein kinase)